MELYCKTATDKIFEIQFMGDATIGITNVLYIVFVNKSMMDIVPIFSNPEETNYIRGYVGGELQKEYRGYVNLIEAIVPAGTNDVRVALTSNMSSIGEI